MKYVERIYDFSAISDSREEKCVDVSKMLRNKVLKIFNRCHIAGRLIIWKNLEYALMHEPFWLTLYRAKSVIKEARKVTEHQEFKGGEVKNEK